MRREWKGFLLLGVMLFSIMLFGCTDPKVSEPEPLRFHHLVNVDSISEIRLYSLPWSAHMRIEEREQITSFLQQYIQTPSFTEDAQQIADAQSQITQSGVQTIYIYLTLDDDCQCYIEMNRAGNAILHLGDRIYALERDQKLDYEGIISTVG